MFVGKLLNILLTFSPRYFSWKAIAKRRNIMKKKEELNTAYPIEEIALNLLWNILSTISKLLADFMKAFTRV